MRHVYKVMSLASLRVASRGARQLPASFRIVTQTAQAKMRSWHRTQDIQLIQSAQPPREPNFSPIYGTVAAEIPVRLATEIVPCLSSQKFPAGVRIAQPALLKNSIRKAINFALLFNSIAMPGYFSWDSTNIQALLIATLFCVCTISSLSPPKSVSSLAQVRHV